MTASDTSPEMSAAQEAIWAGMSPLERVNLALTMSEELRELTRARVRQEHPEWSDREVQIELFRLAYLPDSLPWWVR